MNVDMAELDGRGSNGLYASVPAGFSTTTTVLSSSLGITARNSAQSAASSSEDYSSIDRRLSSSYAEHSHTNSAGSSSRIGKMIAGRGNSSTLRTSPLMSSPYAYPSSLGDASTGRRYASSPLAGNSSLARFQSTANASAHGLRTPPQPFSALCTSPDARFMSHSPTSPSSLRRSPGGGANLRSRRRFSEQSFGSMGGGAALGGMMTNGSSLVGSYEESLLTGRMSTVPSKPLTFDAELGVLAMGKCKSALRCPPHINLKFPAHFYNLAGASSEMEGKVSPSSPYVGTIDLENYYIDQLLSHGEDDRPSERPFEPLFGIDQSQRMFRTQSSQPAPLRDNRRKKGNGRPTFPGYRVPPKGQIQLVIKNPNLTAVKVFLVPYDLSGMPAGKKTFVRQKSHVAVSIPAHDASIPTSMSPPASRTSRSIKEALRYAVHLQFCAVHPPQGHRSSGGGNIGVKPGFEGDNRLRTSPTLEDGREVDQRKDSFCNKNASSEPRYYLHKNIRVVFTARVPDKSEKLTNSNESPRDGNGDGVYSTFTGPGEEWTEARKVARERILMPRSRHDEEELDRITAAETARLRIDHDEASVFDQSMANSDPNGERWAVQPTPPGEIGDEVPMDVENLTISHPQDVFEPHSRQPDAMDIPVQRTASWNAPFGETPSHARLGTPMQVAPTQATSVPSTHSLSRSRAPSIDAMRYSARPAASLGSLGANEGAARGQASDDRALLQQWHASLASRSQQQLVGPRPSSPSSMRSRPTSPPLQLAVSQARPSSPRYAFSPPSNTAYIGTMAGAAIENPFTLTSIAAMQRTSSNASATSDGTASSASSSRASSMRLRGNLRLGDLMEQSPQTPAVPAQTGLQSPKLSVASIEMEHANGVMATSSSLVDEEKNRPDLTSPQNGQSGVLKARPTLLRRLSSQASIKNQPTSRSESPAVASPAPSLGLQAGSSVDHTPQPSNSTLFSWRSTNRHRSSSDDSQT